MSGAESRDGGSARRPFWPGLFIERSEHDSKPRLLASRCTVSSQVFYPAAAICPLHFDVADLQRVELDGSARLVAWTRVSRAPTGYPSPHVFALVSLDAGPYAFAPLVVKPDAQLQADCRLQLDIGVIRALPDGTELVGPVFRPIGDTE